MTDTPDPHPSDPQRPGQPPAGPGGPGQPPAAPQAPNPYAAGSPTGPGAPGHGLPPTGGPGQGMPPAGGTPPAGGVPPTPPSDLPPGPPAGDEPRRFNPLLGLLLVLAIAILAATQLLGGDDDEGTVPPPPVATTPSATTPDAGDPAATSPDATTPDGTTPGGVAPDGDDPTVTQAKTAVRTLVPLVQDCFARTQDYTQCVADPAITGAGIPISDEPTPGGVRLKASAADSFAIIAPDAAGRNWVFKKNAGVPSKRTCEQRGDAPCASKTW